ncbi:flippase [Haladaptatus sp. DFWS20]|uniref:flippase n=1 Tax=Haladaptatus sp. DFWS20 TaxID=3403467 RepID=UPI003EC06455
MPDAEDIETLLSSATLVLFGTILSSVSGLIERVIIGRALGPSDYGVVSVCIAIVTLASTGSMFGLTQGIPRYMSRFEMISKKRGVWASGLAFAGALSVATTGSLLLFAEKISARLLGSSEFTPILKIFVLSIPLLTLLKITVSAIRGEENTIFRTYSQDLLYPLSRIGLLGSLLFVGIGIISPAFAYFGGAMMASIAAIYLLNRLMSLKGSVEWHFRELVIFSAPLTVSMMMSILLTRTDTIMIGYFRSSTEVGLYSAAYPIAAGLQLVLSSFGFLYLPLASRLDAKGKRDETEAIYELTTKWIFIITFPAFAVFVLFSDDILQLFWGSGYSGAALSLSILSIGFFSSAAAGRNRETISAFGYTKYIMYANTLAFVVNMLLNLYLIPEFGYLGASISSALSFLLLNLFVYVVLSTKFGVSPFSKYSIRTFISLPVLVLPPVAILSRIIQLPSLFVILVLPILGIVSLITVAIVGGLQPEDKIPILLIEENVPFTIPYVRDCIPKE